MAQETALNFIDAVRHDTALRMKLTQLHPGDIDGVLDIAGLHGYEFTRDEYLRAMRDYQSRETAGAPSSFTHIPGFNQK